MGIRYFLIPANYLAFDFNHLFKLEEGHDSGSSGRVLWNINKNDAKINVGDICYLYYSNLPDKTSRIILRGTVSASDSYNDEEATFLEPGQRCIELENLETINWRNTGRRTFTYEDLRKYGVKITRNKRELKDGRSGDKALREALEDYYARDTERLGLNELRDDILKKLRCAFDDNMKDRSRENIHSSFVQPNGFRYFETHHFIQQNICRRKEHEGDQSLLDAIYDDRNLIFLCPTCHRKIHYGKKNEVKSMIKRLYDKNASFYNSAFGTYAKNDGDKTVLDWIYEMYKIDADEAILKTT